MFDIDILYLDIVFQEFEHVGFRKDLEEIRQGIYKLLGY